MKYYKNLYNKVISLENLILAYKKARKGKTKKGYILDFERNLIYNLRELHNELKNQTYSPKPLETFILRDPKTREISKSIFRDRIVHHALCNVVEPFLDRTFIYDSCANRKGKGTLFALERFEKFQKKVTDNLSKEAYCLKADIRHYFKEIDREILLNIVKKKIKCEKTIKLIALILNNFEKEKGLPLGNLTSQFFANVYLNEFDWFVKNRLKVRCYIRYVDDFVILCRSRRQLDDWKEKIEKFLKSELKIELHPEKSKITSLSRGIDFVGFKIFYGFRIVRRRNVRNLIRKLRSLENSCYFGSLLPEKFNEMIQGWLSYISMGDNFKLKLKILSKIKFLTVPHS